MKKFISDPLAQIVLAWGVGFGIGYALMDNLTWGAVLGALVVGLLMWRRPSWLNKLALAISFGGTIYLWTGNQTAGIVGGTFIAFLPMLISLAFHREPAPQPAPQQAPAQAGGGGGVRAVAEIRDIGGGLSEELLQQMRGWEGIAGELANFVLLQRLGREAMQLGWRPPQERNAEAQQPRRQPRRRIRNLLQGGKRTIPRM